MTLLERLLRRWRTRLVWAWVPPGARVLDIWCGPGESLAGLGEADASADVVLLTGLHQTMEKAPLCREFFRLLRPGGRVIVTLPAKGSADFDPLTTPRLFAAHGFILQFWRPIQLGSYYLFVLYKPAEAVPPSAPQHALAEDAIHVQVPHAA